MRVMGLLAMMAGHGLVACGDDDDEANRGNPASLVSACEDYCEASSTANCGGLTLTQCQAGCSLFPEQLGGFCIAEYTDTFECASQGTFTCQEETPIPNNTACASAAQALVACMDGLECKRFCAEAIAAGCGGGTEQHCLNTCEADLERYDDIGGCDSDYERVLECWSDGGVTCDGDRPDSQGCEDDILRMGECLQYDVGGICAGYCWAADHLGCGDGCQADCDTKVADSTCGFDYEQLLACHLRSGATCSGDTLSSAEFCDYEQERYDTCMAQ